MTLSTNYDVDTGSATSLSCTVTVSDGELTDTATLNVIINNINDNTPTFTASSYSFFASSTADVGTIIASLPATDGDIGTFGRLLNLLIFTIFFFNRSEFSRTFTCLHTVNVVASFAVS